MIVFRALRGEDVGMLTEHLADDPAGAARISVAPSQWWQLVQSDPGRHGWVIEHDGEVIGYLDAEQSNEQDLEQDLERAAKQHGEAKLSVLYLALLLFPAARGRGLARKALRQALALPELATAPVLLAYVEPDNRPARRTLLGAGFVENGHDPDGLIEHRRRRGDHRPQDGDPDGHGDGSGGARGGS